MSVVDRRDVKITLPTAGTDPFWDALLTEFAGDDERLWRYLAMLALRETAGWRLHEIGRVFGHNKGHVSRCLRSIRKDIRNRCQIDTEAPPQEPPRRAA